MTDSTPTKYTSRFEGMVAGFDSALRLIKKRICCATTEDEAEALAKNANGRLDPILVDLEEVAERYRR